MSGGLKRLEALMFPLPDGKYLIGFSGGADSTALFHLMLRQREERGITLAAIHIHHGLRGAEADGDERFVREMCEEHRVPFISRRLSPGGKRDEETAREGRWACFREEMRNTGSDYLALAHQRDDQAETFLMRLLRGAGPEGLGCMKPDSVRNSMRVIRPMLDIGAEEIREALREEGIPWREDGTNAGNDYFRNQVRHLLIPAMERLSSGAVEKMAAAASLIGEDNNLLNSQADAFLAGHAGKDWMELSALRGLPKPLAVRALRRWWGDYAPELKERSLSREQTRALLEAALDPEKAGVNLPGSTTMKKGRLYLHLTGREDPAPPPSAIGPEGAVFGEMTLRILPGRGNPGDGKREQEIPEGFLEGCTVRTRRNGDRIRPFGMKGQKKLQDYLTDRHVDEPWRDRIPLICRGNEVLMAAGVGTGAVPALDGSRASVRIVWEGEMPWNLEEKKSDRHEF